MAEKQTPSTRILGLFNRMDTLGIDPKATAVAYLARRRQDPDYATLRRLCVANLGLRGVKLGRKKNPQAGGEAPAPNL